MFTRKAGWITTPATTGYVDHYFREGQTKALCGIDFINGTNTHLDPSPYNSTCKRCFKYPKIMKIRVRKRMGPRPRK